MTLRMYGSFICLLCTWLMVTGAYLPSGPGRSLKLTITELAGSDFIVETPTRPRKSSSSLMFEDSMSQRLQFSGDINFELPSVIYAGIDELRFRWPGGIVPCEVATSEFGEEELNVIARAMQSYHSSTCIRFVQRDSENDKFGYLKIQKGTTPGLCNSAFGLVTGEQVINLGAGCALSVGIVIHELMHTIGFLHEQSRSDRDSYVSILWDNIEEENQSQFEILNGVKTIGSYDISSVMHYESYAYSKNGLPTIQPHDRTLENRMGNRAGFSSADVGKINSMYKCHLPIADRKDLYVKEKRAVNLYRCEAFHISCSTDATDEGFPTDSTDGGYPTDSTDDGSDGKTPFGQTGRGGCTTDRTDRESSIDSTDRKNPFESVDKSISNSLRRMIDFLDREYPSDSSVTAGRNPYGQTGRSNPYGRTDGGFPTDWTDRAGPSLDSTDRESRTRSLSRTNNGYSFEWNK